MWRNFDTGLYEFMRFHLFRPAREFLERSEFIKYKALHYVIAVIATYAFVGLWHGFDKGIFMFAGMNCVGMLGEYMASKISSALELSEQLSPRNYRRFVAAICTFSIQWSWASFFFFGE